MIACLTRRALLLAAAAVAAPASQAQRERYRLICGFPPGGSPDLVTRKVADSIQERTGSVALVDNKPGAAGRLAVAELRRAPADGRSVLVTPASVMTMYPHVYAHLGYDVFRDVQPVCTLAATAFALAVGPKVPAHVADLPAFLRWCRSHRADSQCGNAGAGSMPHFLAVLIAREAGIELDHVPFRGGLAAMQAVAGGELAAALATEFSASALHRAGKLRVLATTGAARTASFPQVQTFGELGFPLLVQREWFGVFAPAATPASAVTATAGLLRPLLDEPDVQETWRRMGLQVDALSPEDLQRAVRTEHDFWGALVRLSGFTPES